MCVRRNVHVRNWGSFVPMLVSAKIVTTMSRMRNMKMMNPMMTMILQTMIEFVPSSHLAHLYILSLHKSPFLNQFFLLIFIFVHIILFESKFIFLLVDFRLSFIKAGKMMQYLQWCSQWRCLTRFSDGWSLIFLSFPVLSSGMYLWSENLIFLTSMVSNIVSLSRSRFWHQNSFRVPHLDAKIFYKLEV